MDYRPVLAVIVAVVTVSGCTGQPAAADGAPVDAPTDAGDSSLEVEQPKLLLNWKIGALHTPYFAAKSQGFYRAEGFDTVKIASGKGSDFSAQQVALGNAEFAVTSMDQILAVNANSDLNPVAVAAVMQKNPVVIFTAREQFGETLTDPAQLAGRTVGSGPGMVRQMTRAYLDAHGVLDEVTYTQTGYDTVQQLLTGKIDAAGGVFGDVVDARQTNRTIDVLRVQNTIPSYGHVIAVDREFAAAHPETVRAFLRATARGAAWADQHPARAIDAVIAAEPALSSMRSGQRTRWDMLRKTYMRSDAVREHGWGWMRSVPWNRTYTVLRQGGFLDERVETGSVWTNAYLNTSYRYIGNYTGLVTD